MRRIRGKLTYSNVISTLCLALVLGGGTAYAATQVLPKNSVGAKQLKKGAVTPAKLSPAASATLTGPAGPAGAKGSTGATGPRGATGVSGPKGATGAQGAKGDQGIQGKDGLPGPEGLPGGDYFAQVNREGTSSFIGEHPGFTAVERKATGIYCLTVEALVDYSYPVASVEGKKSTGEDLLVTPRGGESTECGAGKLEVHTYTIDGGVAASDNVSFTVFLPQP